MFEAALGEGRALEVLDGADFGGQFQTLLAFHRRQALLGQHGQRLAVLAQINLGPHLRIETFSPTTSKATHNIDDEPKRNLSESKHILIECCFQIQFNPRIQ